MTKREIFLASVVVFLLVGLIIGLTLFDLQPKQSNAIATLSDDPMDGLPYAGDGIKRRIGFV